MWSWSIKVLNPYEALGGCCCEAPARENTDNGRTGCSGGFIGSILKLFGK